MTPLEISLYFVLLFMMNTQPSDCKCIPFYIVIIYSLHYSVLASSKCGSQSVDPEGVGDIVEVTPACLLTLTLFINLKLKAYLKSNNLFPFLKMQRVGGETHHPTRLPRSANVRALIVHWSNLSNITTIRIHVWHYCTIQSIRNCSNTNCFKYISASTNKN